MSNTTRKTFKKEEKEYRDGVRTFDKSATVTKRKKKRLQQAIKTKNIDFLLDLEDEME